MANFKRNSILAHLQGRIELLENDIMPFRHDNTESQIPEIYFKRIMKSIEAIKNNLAKSY